MLSKNQEEFLINWSEDVPLNLELKHAKKYVFERFDRIYRNIWLSLYPANIETELTEKELLWAHNVKTSRGVQFQRYKEIDGILLPKRNTSTALVPGFDLINHRYPGNNCKWKLVYNRYVRS